MKTQTILPDNELVTINSILELSLSQKRYLDRHIKKILEQYNSEWVNDESEVDMSAMSELDCVSYNLLFSSRLKIKATISKLTVLA